MLNAFIESTESLNIYDAASTHQVFQDILTKFEKGVGAVMPLIRVALTGVMQGPPVFEIMALLGKEESSNRLRTAVTRFDSVEA